MKKFLVGCVIAAALVGCTNGSDVVVSDANQSVDEVSISESNVDIEVETEEIEDKEYIEEDANDDNLFNSGNDSVDKLAMEEVVLSQEEVIHNSYWVTKDKLYRVQIDYADTPADEYAHKRDEFFYVGDDGNVTSFEVKYTTKYPTDDSHQVFQACDFYAELVDVNFDGREDVVISLGFAGAQGALVHTVYLGSDDGFILNKSFEDIANYKLDSENQLIYGSYRSNAGTRASQSYKYDSTANSFVLVEETVIDESMEILFSLVGALTYDYYVGSDGQDYLVLSRYGEVYDGSEFVNDKRMLTTDLEYFYREVMGEDRRFTPGQAHSPELAAECRDDGYCYTYNGGVGLMGYFAVKNITVNGDVYQVEVGYYDDIDNEIDSVTFSMKAADNKYGYTLVK